MDWHVPSWISLQTEKLFKVFCSGLKVLGQHVKKGQVIFVIDREQVTN